MRSYYMPLILGGLLCITGCSPSKINTNTTTTTTTTTTTIIQSNTASYSAFIPAHYTLLSSAEGDLNDDSISDAALVLKSESEDADESETSTDDYPPRLLVVLAGQKAGGYTQIVSSERAVLCKQCGGVFGDPFESITIDKGGDLEINHYGGSRDRWGYTHVFEWKNSNLYLVSQDVGSLDNLLLTDENTHTNFETGDVTHTYGVPDNYENNPDFSDSDIKEIAQRDKPTEHKKIKMKPLVRLEDFDVNRITE